jgi:Glycine cleavage system regulatory protein
MKTTSKNYLITAILKDRVGILRDITDVIYRVGGNLTDVRQNIMAGQFVLNCLVEFGQEVDGLEFKLSLMHSVPENTAYFVVTPISTAAIKRAKQPQGGRYVAAISGADKPGRVHKIADFFAARGVNVEDWKHDFSSPPNALTIGIVTIPPTADLSKMQTELTAAMSADGLKASLTHENIFRATNEVGPISSLI